MKRGAKKPEPLLVPGAEIGRWSTSNIKDSEVVLLARAIGAVELVPAVQVEKTAGGSEVLIMYALEPAVFEQVKQHARRVKATPTEDPV